MTNAGTFSGYRGNSSVTLTANVAGAAFGNIVMNDATGTWSWSANALDRPPGPEGPVGPYTVTITATDSGGATSTTAFTYSIDELAPTAALNVPTSISEGIPFAISLTNPVDPNTIDPSPDFHYAFAVDGASLAGTTYADSGTSASESFLFDDGPSTHTVTARIFDDDGGFTQYQATFQVSSVAPTATLSTNSGVAVGNMETASFAAPFDPSAADTAAGFHYAFSFFSNTIGSATYASSGTASSVSFGNFAPGTYTVYARIIDKDNSSTFYTAIINVLPAPSNVSVRWTDGASATYNGNSHAAFAQWVSIDTNGSLPVTYVGINGTNYGPTATPPTNAGNYQASAVFAGDTDHAGNSGTANFTIAPADAHASVTGYLVSYDGKSHSAAGSAVDINGHALPGSDFTLTGTNHAAAGTYNADAWSFSDPSGNYNTASGIVSDGISQVGSTVMVAWTDGTSATYDGDPHSATAIWTSAGSDGENGSLPVAYVGIDGTAYGPTATPPTNLGSYEASATFSGDANHTGSSNIADFAITPSEVYVSPTFAGMAIGQQIDDADLGTAGNQPAVFGADAFATIADAQAAIGDSGTILVNSGVYAEMPSLTGQTLRLSGVVTLASLDTGPSAIIDLNDNTLIVGNDSGNDIIRGNFAAGPGNLVKVGLDTLILAGNESFTGATTVAFGTLVVDSATDLSFSTTVLAGATLGGSGTLSGSVANLGAITPSAAGTPGTLAIDGTLDLNPIAGSSPGTLALAIVGGGASDGVTVVNTVSTVNLSGATLSLTASGTFTMGEHFTILTVPGASGGTTGSFSGGSTITVGSESFSISYVGGDGNDVVLTALNSSGSSSSPSIVGTVLNGGLAYIHSTLAAKQHSMVESVVYSFSQAVSLNNSNFALTGLPGSGTTVAPNANVSSSDGGAVWTVTFSGAGVNTSTHSIGDGEYQLVLSGVSGLATDTYDFFRLLGDMDGSGGVDSGDLLTLNGTFLRSPSDPAYQGAADFDSSGTIDSADLLQFDSNFLHTVPKMSNGQLPN